MEDIAKAFARFFKDSHGIGKIHVIGCYLESIGRLSQEEGIAFRQIHAFEDFLGGAARF
jgi:hypothetical protein